MGVLADFDAIDRYLSLSQQAEEDEFSFDSEEMITLDQKVPQAMVKQENLDLVFTNCDYSALDLLGGELPPANSAPSPIYITDSGDVQVLRGSESPNLLDLDSFEPSQGSDVSFYEDSLKLHQHHQQQQEFKCDPLLPKRNGVNSPFEGELDISGYNPQSAITTPTTQSGGLLARESHPTQPSYQLENEVYHDMMMELKEEIQSTCSALRIEADPQLWSRDQIRQWIAWQCRKFNQRSPSLDLFDMTGAEFSLLSEGEFVKRAPAVGTLLYHRLDIWQSARGCSFGQQTTPTQTVHDLFFQQPDYFHLEHQHPQLSQQQHNGQQQQQQQQQHSEFELQRIPVPCLSPAPSYHSDDSMSSSTNLPSPLSDAEEYCSKSGLKDDVCMADEHSQKQTIQLWQFLRQLLHQPHAYSDCIKWLDQRSGIFKIENSNRVAKLWGQRKKRPAMNYDKLSRSIRQYYRKGIIKKTENSKRLVYQFCSKYL